VLLSQSPEELKKRREYLKKEFGFTIEEQRYIARRKPNFMLYDLQENRGIESLTKLLVK